MKIIALRDNVFRTKCKKKDFGVKFRIILVFGVSGWGMFGKEIPEKITKTVPG